MKKILALILVVVCVSACTTTTETNNQGMQAQKNNILWRSKSVTATLTTSSHLIVTGYTENETLTIDLANFLIGEYAIGGTNSSKVGFEYTNENGMYSYTSVGATPLGKVIITKSKDGMVSGTFYFYTKNTATGTSLEPATTNFQYGAFFDIPLQ
jgi:hypothetical protein